ncbi:MAG: YraN family protein [Lachnospiraceae bacterium]|nr:YraN family protein [Lachnospiraceae bacterium]
MNRRKIGKKYEDAVAKVLENHGFCILERNFRCRIGEIDLIALDGEHLVFIEVKYRKDKERGWPEQAVGLHKQRIISRVADYYRVHHPEYENYQIRFDVAAILDTRWRLYRNAFEYQRGNVWK